MVAEKSPKNEDGYLLVMKGAPEKIWSLCSTLMVDGQERLIDDEWTKRFIQTYEQLGGMGERCLGCCQLWLPTRDFPVPTQFDAENPNFPLDGLTFLGMFSLIDPIRCTVPDAVIKCRAAGRKSETSENTSNAVLSTTETKIIQNKMLLEICF